jgi:cyclic beta-1,2-glucan synthetase
MPQNTHVEMAEAEAIRIAEEKKQTTASDFAALCKNAEEISRCLAWNPSVHASSFFSTRWKVMAATLKPVLEKVARRSRKLPESEDLRWLRENLNLLWAGLWNTRNAFKKLRRLPHVLTPRGTTIPRVAAAAEAYLYAAEFNFSDASLTAYIGAFQENTALKFRELWALVSAMELALLEQIAARSKDVFDETRPSQSIGACVRSLREINQLQWKEVLEPQIAFDQILRQDPAGAYARMDFESRNLYREKLVLIAERSDSTEMEVATQALELARQARERPYDDPRVALRESHIGYYLMGAGTAELRARIAFRPSLAHKIRSLLRRHPDEFYLPGIEILTFGLMSLIVLLLTSTITSPALVLLSMLVLLLPCSQSAVQLMNYLTTALLRPEILPKFDFSKDIPEDCTTLVAVPALLLNEKQVRRLVDNLEVRFLGNHNRNLHFALLTDLPDSPVPSREDDPLVELCSNLIKELNEKYSGKNMGSFLMLHRHRIYNPREKVWMGWERKRGKLMDLNKLLTRERDSFPVKVGDLAVLAEVSFVITLDADTELPRGSAHRLIGTLAHPLNRAVIDPEKNIVIAGYGILQPRVRISVHSAASSRLANIYSGQTGFDIYTRAVSDIYQDLYGEGIFAGKGIYEVETVHRVLDRRFPQNALLSHDLIEGAYARVGLVTDVEVIEDYPSHYSAYNRRKHRWLRGDWQITSWLFSKVPDETGRKVPNPISLVSQWKILDNLRRSLVEPATFLLFVLGWLVLPGYARSWTLAAAFILFMPVWSEFLFTLVRSIAEQKLAVAREALSVLFSSNVGTLLNIIFLPHQMLVSLDAVVRTVIRRVFTRQRLLEWETAAEAESGAGKRTPVDVYLNWMPVIAIILGLIVFLVRRPALVAAVPVLVLWACSKLVSKWLDSPAFLAEHKTSEKERLFLRRSAIHTWRYFAEFSAKEHNWLVPDNLQEEPYRIAARISPTNVGFLLNARQVACELGYSTASELVEHSSQTLATIRKMPRHRGHLYNWYDTRTLQPLPPLFISTVDSGNLVASLWTLQQGCLHLLHQPILRRSLAEGFLDHLQELSELGVFPRRLLTKVVAKSRTENWIGSLLKFPPSALARIATREKHPIGEVQWYATQALVRLNQFRRALVRFTPWVLPDFAELRRNDSISFPAQDLKLKDLPDALTRLATRLHLALQSDHLPAERNSLERLLSMISGARMDCVRLIQELKSVAAEAEKLAEEMEFGFLWNRQRKMMSIGFESEKDQVHSACYDLLASESRLGTFVAVAKDEVPSETWFLLARAHTTDRGRPVLISWTGTMFEYLMPTLWMRSYPGTLLDRSHHSAMLSHQDFTALKNIPWGISECAYAERDDAENYRYHAFGVPQLAIFHGDVEALVISPYSTFLALNMLPAPSLKNLRRMQEDGWFGTYGFYEAADFTSSRNRSWRHEPKLVRCWMAHHQGMTLLALGNFLAERVVQTWFHSHPRVQATELLLHERPVNYLPAQGTVAV